MSKFHCRYAGCAQRKEPGRGRSYCEEHRAIRAGENSWSTWNRRNPDSAREWREDRYSAFQRFIWGAKDAPCADCGVKYGPHVMDFDHLDPTIKTWNVGQMYGYSLVRVQAEIDKCEVVCANCHRERGHRRKHHQVEEAV